jgi:hypothetical protein
MESAAAIPAYRLMSFLSGAFASPVTSRVQG